MNTAAQFGSSIAIQRQKLAINRGNERGWVGGGISLTSRDVRVPVMIKKTNIRQESCLWLQWRNQTDLGNYEKEINQCNNFAHPSTLDADQKGSAQM